MSINQLRTKANELWDTIVKLETEKYDLEERQKRQDYDVSKINLILGAIQELYVTIGDFQLHRGCKTILPYLAYSEDD